MDAPRYVVTLTGVTRGWIVTATHGDEVDLDDLALRVVPLDPFIYSWGFEQDVIPNPTVPDRVTFTLASRTAVDEPAVDLGDVVTALVTFADAGPDIVRTPRLRVTEVETTVVAGEVFPIRTTVTAVDYRSELAATYPEQGNGSITYFPRRFGLIAQAAALSVGLPTSWPVGPGSPGDKIVGSGWNGDSGNDHAAELLAGYVPAGIHYALVPYYGAGYPAGHRWADGGYTVEPGAATGPPLPDPATLVKLLAVPASRKQTVAFQLPLQFVDRDGVLDVISTPAAGPRMPAVSARYCEVPATARRTRDHLVNTVVVNGYNELVFGGENRPSTYTHRDTVAIAARGAVTRTVDTQLVLRTYSDPENPEQTSPVLAGVPAVAATFLAQPATTLAYKDFVVLGHTMPQAVAEAVLPYLTPSYPGDGRDGRLVRHITIASIPEELQLRDAEAAGFITSGQVVIERGEIRFELTTSPGRPEYPNTPAAITVGQFTAASYATDIDVPDVDHTLTVADLDLIGA